jgi:YVTN family beta-propeller protein
VRSKLLLLLASLLPVTVPPLFAQTVVATIPVGVQPFMVAANPKTNRVYVTNQGDKSLSVIDGLTNQIVNTVTFPGIGLPYGVGVNVVTNRVYVVFGHSLLVLDGNTNAIVRSIKVGNGPDRVAVNGITNRIYVTNESDATVSVIDGSESQVIATVPVNGGAVGIAVNPATNRIYVPPFFCSLCDVAVIDGATNSVETNFALPGDQLDDTAADPLSNRLYVIDETAGMFVVDGNTNNLLGTITGLHAPETVAILPGLKFVVEADFGSNNAIFVDSENFTISQRVPVGVHPTGTAVDPGLRRVYMVNKDSQTVSVLSY